MSSAVLAVYRAIDLLEITMANLKGMNVQALLSLRTQIDRRLAEVRAELEKQLEALSTSKRKAVRTGSSLRGRKWPAPGSEDTELGVLMELEVGHGETEVYPRIQA